MTTLSASGEGAPAPSKVAERDKAACPIRDKAAL